MVNIAYIAVFLSIKDVFFDFDAFSVSGTVGVSGTFAGICSSKGILSICFLKLSNTGWMSMRETLLNGSTLCPNVFVQLSLLCECDTVLMEASVSTVFPVLP